jgi:hypothetical protein
MEEEVLFRERYGDCYITKLPDGLIVPWRSLTVAEFIKYDRLLVQGTYPRAVIEDEIFTLCVQNVIQTKELKSFSAGSIEIVAKNILSYSGPSSIDELTYLLELSRGIAQEVFHQIVIRVCQGFPAYKPEDVYGMDMLTMMLRLAQAEDKLIKQGNAIEPFSFFSEEEETQKAKPKVSQENLKEQFEKTQPKPAPPKPVSTQQTIITTHDIKESTTAYTGHEKEDRILLEHKMIKETVHLPHIQEYMDQMKKDGKVTIKSHEERQAEALQRAKDNEELVNKMAVLKSEKDKAELEKLAEEMKAKTSKRPKKRKRGLRRG